MNIRPTALSKAHTGSRRRIGEMMNWKSWMMAAMMAGTALTGVVSSAQAESECVAQWRSCTNAEAKPGEAAKQARQCDNAFDKCVREEKRDCKKECKERKSAAKSACKDAFKETQCPIKGKEKRECVKDARAAKRMCMEAASKNCNKMCK